MHFVNTGNAMVSNPGMTWDQASIGSGISMSYSFNPGWDAQRTQTLPNEGTINYGNGQYYGTEPVAFINTNFAERSNVMALNSRKAQGGGGVLPSWSSMNANYPKNSAGGDMAGPDVYKMCLVLK